MNKSKHFRNRLNHNFDLGLSLKLFFASILFLFASHSVLATEEFLEPEQAFKLEMSETTDKSAVVLKFDIAPGYRLYRDHIHFFTTSGKSLKKLEKSLPPATLIHDKDSGDYAIYTKHLEINLPKEAIGKENGLKVEYQGCAEQGFCYPPMEKTFNFTQIGNSGNVVNDSSSSSASMSNPREGSSISGAANAEPFESETDKVEAILNSHNLFLTLASFLGLGLLLAFTPCVLPMLPIMANILVGQSDKPLSKKRSLYLASLYVLSVAVCYAVAGLVAGLIGNSFQLALQHPYLLVALSFMLLLFALNQFNILHVQLPQIFSHSFRNFQQKQKQGSAVSAIVFGALSALMLSPCVTPALIGALTFISQTGNATLGGIALFVMAIGMGLPLMGVAVLGSHLLPKAGAWMNHIKSITGLLLIALALSILYRAIPLSIEPAETKLALTTSFTEIHDADELSKALNHAKAANKPVLLDVYADWCVSCKQMDKEVFENKKVQQTLEKVYLLRLDMTRQNQNIEQLQKKLQIIGPPTVLFFAPNGEEIRSYRLAGKSESDSFIRRVDHFLHHITSLSKK